MKTRLRMPHGMRWYDPLVAGCVTLLAIGLSTCDNHTRRAHAEGTCADYALAARDLIRDPDHYMPAPRAGRYAYSGPMLVRSEGYQVLYLGRNKDNMEMSTEELVAVPPEGESRPIARALWHDADTPEIQYVYPYRWTAAFAFLAIMRLNPDAGAIEADEAVQRAWDELRPGVDHDAPLPHRNALRLFDRAATLCGAP